MYAKIYHKNKKIKWTSVNFKVAINKKKKKNWKSTCLSKREIAQKHNFFSPRERSPNFRAVSLSLEILIKILKGRAWKVKTSRNNNRFLSFFILSPRDHKGLVSHCTRYFALKRQTNFFFFSISFDELLTDRLIFYLFSIDLISVKVKI